MATGSDITLLTDEKFDFDVSLSPTSAKEDEDCDEVFIGPVGHREKCVSAVIQCKELEEKTPPQNTERSVWSPLSGDKFVEIFKEAHLLALQLECFASGDQKNEEPPQTVPKPVETFAEESKTKLNLFETLLEINKTPIALKRETYCIQDSPFHQLPPSVQQRFAALKTGSDSKPAVEFQNSASPLKVPKVVKTFSNSPLAQKTKAKQMKSNVPLPNTGKTVSKLQPLKAPAVHMKNNRLAVEKPKAAKKLSPIGRKNLSSMGSTEDLLSDKSSIASDVSDSSFNSSIVGPSKRSLPVPNKVALNKMQFKTPAAAVAFRKNTTSSSSSQSSLNSSISSPAANAKLNKSINTSLNNSISSSRQKPNTCKFALVRPLGGMSSVLKTTTSDVSTNNLKPSTSAKTSSSKSTSVSVADSQTPAGKFQRQTSAPNLQRLPPPSKPESAVKGLTIKPQARVMPTPTSRLKPPPKTDGVSPDRVSGKPMKPTRLLSCGEIGSGIDHSTPIGVAKGVLANSVLGRGISSTPSSKHVSALPTPLGRRTSGIVTPRTIPRSISCLRPIATLQASRKSVMKPVVKSTEHEQIKAKVTKSPSSPSEADATAAICCSLNFSPENKPAPFSQNEKQQSVAYSSPAQVLLIDIGAHDVDNNKVRKPSSVEIDSQPLIDLSNTPELNKRLVPVKQSNVGQLIDLSSPLIKLSPAVNKENVELDYPLLTF